MAKMTDAQITAYEAFGFRRWTKGAMDRLYIDATELGAKIDYYGTGNVRNAEWRGERVSNSDGRRLLSSKVYVDVDTGELSVTTSFDAPYGMEGLEDAARELVESVEAALAEAEEYARPCAYSEYDGHRFRPIERIGRTANSYYGAAYLRDMLVHTLYVLDVLRDPERDPEPDAEEMTAMEQELDLVEWHIETLDAMFEDGCEDTDTAAYHAHM